MSLRDVELQDVNVYGTIKVSGVDLTRTEHFKYLGSSISADGSLKHEANARVNAAWLKWRSITGVLCDHCTKDRLKSKIYRAVIRPVALYGSECWPTTKEIECRLAVMETKMLRWISGNTRFDHIRNDDIRRRYGVVHITEKMREARLRWYGHVLRSDAVSLAHIGFSLEVPGKRPKGRPKQRWTDTLHIDLAAARLHPDQAHDREKWRLRSRRADPATER
ncbi:uncharacterized protein LOC134329566, partial [Trichomycterus rosablanca]|uniref:uncharacterized protein LOC134329566 n=1 Tax=Trichomycterus rosablanca TaxID=2290929 RepID=UPI002F35A194